MRRTALGWWLVLILAVPGLAGAQDQGLDLLLFARLFEVPPDVDVEARTVQLYRLPLSFRVRQMEEGQWGLRITFPISLSAVRIETVSEIRQFVRSLGVAAILPGIELEIPAHPRLRLRPFAEIGIGRGDGTTKALYGGGLRARLDRPLKHAHLMFGGSGMYRKLAASGDEYDGHATFEGAIDAQFPLGFAIGGSPARGGLYTIARGFNGLDLKTAGRPPIVMRHQFETGISFATSPDLRIWKIRLPWLAAGYQFGEVLSGLRFYTAFPF